MFSEDVDCTGCCCGTPWTILGVNWRLDDAGDLVLRLEYSDRSGVCGGFGS